MKVSAAMHAVEVGGGGSHQPRVCLSRQQGRLRPDQADPVSSTWRHCLGI
jgi:hypothetical protein